MQNDTTLQAAAGRLIAPRHADDARDAIDSKETHPDAPLSYEALLPYLLLPMAGSY